MEIPEGTILCTTCDGTGTPKKPKWLEEIMNNPGTSWAAGRAELNRACRPCGGKGYLTPEDIEKALRR